MVRIAAPLDGAIGTPSMPPSLRVRGFTNTVSNVFRWLLGCANRGRTRRSKLRQTKAVASYRAPRARVWSAQACLRLVLRQLAAAPTKSPNSRRQTCCVLLTLQQTDRCSHYFGSLPKCWESAPSCSLGLAITDENQPILVGREAVKNVRCLGRNRSLPLMGEGSRRWRGVYQPVPAYRCDRALEWDRVACTPLRNSG
jgi:hypothetical protein